MRGGSKSAATALISCILAISAFLALSSYIPAQTTEKVTNQQASKAVPSLTLLGAGAHWAANGGNHALYVNWIDYTKAHPNDPNINSPPNATQRTSALINTLTNYNLTVDQAADIPSDLSSYSAIIIDCYQACHPSDSPILSNYFARGGGIVLIGETPLYFVFNDKSGVQPQNDLTPIQDWLGVSLITFNGGQAQTTENNTLGSSLLIHEKVFTGPWGLPSASYPRPGAIPKVLWADGGFFAYTYEQGNGRLYYQASYDFKSPSTFDFNTPMSVAVDSSDNVYVVDYNGVRKFTSSGVLISTYSLTGENLRTPDQIAIDTSGNIYIADWTKDCVLKFSQGDADSPIQVKKLVTPSSTYPFAMPMGVAVDHNGNVFVSDTGGERIVKFDNQGKYVSSWRRPGSGGGYLSMPMGLAINGADIYICDVVGVQKYTLTGMYLRMITSDPPNFSMGNGEVYSPSGVAVDNSGNIYVSDSRNDRIQKFTSDGTFITKWGSTGQKNGQFWLPSGIAVDSQGYVYVADCGNDRVQKFTSDGVFVAAWGVPKLQRGPLSSSNITRHDGWPYELR